MTQARESLLAEYQEMRALVAEIHDTADNDRMRQKAKRQLSMLDARIQKLGGKPCQSPPPTKQD